MTATTELLQAHFRALVAERTAIEASLAGPMAEAAALNAEIDALRLRLDAIGARIAEASAGKDGRGLREVCAEITQVVRALDGRTGPAEAG